MDITSVGKPDLTSWRIPSLAATISNGSAGKDEGGSVAFNVALATYSLRCRDRDEGSYLPLDDLFGRDILALFQDYLDERSDDAREDEADQSLLRVESFDVTDRVITGLIRAGEYGFEAELFDIRQRQISYNRQSTDAELLPFYFLLAVPEGADQAILILERFRQFGIKGVLWKDFRGFFGNTVSDVIPILNTLLPAGLLERVRSEEHVRSIRFIHYGLPSDVATALGAEEPDEDEGILELVVRSGRGNRLPYLDRVNAWLRGGQDYSQAAELLDFDFDTIKIQVEVDGSRRTLDLFDPEGLRAEYNITDQVDRDETGHPTFSSIDEAAREVLDELRAQLHI